uniref:Putative LOC101846787 [Aplysia californica] n=2 Tax=Lepeophtheirus salmonis TaxID=72036 RepID=A0A0K2TTU6_LEPSM
MGLHFNKWGYDESENCSGSFPASLLYSGGYLSGFVWQHFGKFKGDRYEHPPSIFLSFMYRQPPSCLYEAQQTIGLSYMHVYFLSPYTLCILSNV